MPPELEKESGAAGTPESGSPVAPPVSAKSAAQLENMAVMLRQLWQKNLPVLRSRLDQFNAVATALGRTAFAGAVGAVRCREPVVPV